MRYQRIAVALLALGMAVVFLLTAVVAEDRPVPIKIYNDESRSLQLGLQVWKHLKERDGFFQTRVMDLITYERLRQYDVMIVWNQVDGVAYSDEEVSAVKRFVREGGGLLLIGHPRLQPAERAPFRKGRFVDVAPLTAKRYSMNQLAGQFATFFGNASRQGVPQFAGNAPMNDGVAFGKLVFRQPLVVVVPERPQVATTIVRAFDSPVATATTVGKGRVIVCGANRLFMQYGKLPDRKLGRTDAVIDRQKALLVSWLKWLAANSPVADRRTDDLPRSVPARVHLPAEQIDVYCIPQLRGTAERLVRQWKPVWADFSAHTGLSSPLAFVAEALPSEKLQIYLRVAEAGGLSGGTRISIPGMGDDWRLISVLGHEVGHKLIGGCNTSVSEAFAEWFAARALMAAGFDEKAREKIDDHVAEFLEADPKHRRLDIADRITDIKAGKACQGKWVWIMTELCKKYGDQFVKDYVAALGSSVAMAGSHHKTQPNGERTKLTMYDHVAALSQAAGEDLTPWFRQLGITVAR